MADHPEPGALMAQAQAAYAAGRDAEAEAAARAVLRGEPGHVAARHLLAACRLAAGDLAEAAAALEAVVAAQPGRDQAVLHLAQVRLRQGRHGDAADLLRPLVARRPELLAAYRPLAEALWEVGIRDARARDDAIGVWRALVARVPGDAAAQRALALALRQHGGAAAEQVAVLRRALALGDPAEATTLRLELAEALERAAAEARPGLAALDEAVELLREEGHGPDWLMRAAFVRERAGDLDGAEDCYRRVLRDDPGHADARTFLGMLRLARGDFAAGWPDYAWRARDRAVARRPPPAWTVPARLDGVTVRVAVEQGMGDTLQFARYLPLLAARGARVEVAIRTQAAVAPLLRAMPAVADIVAAPDSAPAADAPAPDLVVALLSLPLAFGTDMESIPATVPYFAVPPARRAVWRGRLTDDGRPRVGVAWRGNPAHVHDSRRSIVMERFLRLLRRPGIAFHVLLDRVSAEEAAALAGLATVHDGIGDFADTAALAEVMDLVVTVDTSVAHLAGALGRPVWVLLPFRPDWRWLLERRDSPWYPTMQLFRQVEPGDWDGVLARVEEALDARFR